MKLIHPKWEIIEQKSGLEGIYEQIELAGRVCYKSERKEGATAKNFVDILINKKHLSPLEHGTVYLDISSDAYNTDNLIKRFVDLLDKNPYSKVNHFGRYYITTNYRVIDIYNLIFENLWKKYTVSPTEYHEKRVTVKINCGVDISRELNRHE